MKFPKIFIKVLGATLFLVITYLLFIFLLFIPKIEQNTTNLEDSIGKAQLDKTLQIIQNSVFELEHYESLLLQQHKRELKKLTEVVWNLIDTKYRESNSTTTAIIKSQTLELVSRLQYANSDYFYISDYNSTLISHPYLRGQDFSNVKDVRGNLIVPSLVDIARKNGDGFYRYWWRRNNNDSTPYEKLTYAKEFKPWRWIVGTGVYIDDIQKGVERRKEKLISRLEKTLRSTKIGESGYVYIFDSSGNMIIHPNANIEGTNFRKLKNPDKDSYIFDDLLKAYRDGQKTLYYNWDRPNDKDNYIYKKISWIEYNPYFDWYICSSGYLDEFHRDSNDLKKFIIFSTLLMTILLTTLGLYFLRGILRPTVELSINAQNVIEGNFQSKYRGKITDDEIGLLALQFNKMLDTINEQIDTLDNQVQQKTNSLSIALEEKEILLRELNHRVKNNMNVISSIIGLQAFQGKQIDIEVFVETIQHRIQSMALGHEMLSQSANFTSLDIREYIPKLVESLINAYIPNPNRCQCIYRLDSIPLDLDRLLACGLIINELVTNSIKYAFDSQENRLVIIFEKEGDRIYFSVSDSGECFESSTQRGIGLELVQTLVSQLDGEIEFRCKDGSLISVSFLL